MLSGKTREQFTGWLKTGKQQVTEFVQAFKKRKVRRELFGLVINPQYLKLLKLIRHQDQFEVQYFSIMDLSEGLMTDLEIRNTEIIAGCLKEMLAGLNMESQDVVLAIPRSSTIVKTISVDNRLHADEIESRVWLEANRLFPNLIGDIYLDFAVTGASSNDPGKLDVLIVACRKEQLKPYLDILAVADLTARVVDVNYYAYERSLTLIAKCMPEAKTIAFLNINFGLLDLLGVQDGKLVYTHELTYDGHGLLKLRRNMNSATDEAVDHSEAIKQAIGLHLKHALQFFYSSRPNVRLDKIILGGDVAATVPGVLEYVRKETAKDVVLADPFTEMKFAANVDKVKVERHAPALMLCCGLALTRLGV